MTNKDRKKKVVKWLLIGIGCVVIFLISAFLDTSFASSNSAEYMRCGGIYADPNCMNLFSKTSPLWITVGIALIFSSLGSIISVIMFFVSLIKYWVNKD